MIMSLMLGCFSCADTDSWPLCSGIPLECEIERRPQSEEEYYEDTSSSSQEFEDAAMREEKSLSDSEIKVNFIKV